MEQDECFIVHWVNTITNTTGESQKPMNHAIAKSWTNYLNKKYPFIKHTIKV